MLYTAPELFGWYCKIHKLLFWHTRHVSLTFLTEFWVIFWTHVLKSLCSQDILSLRSTYNNGTTLLWQEGISLNHERGQFSVEPMIFPDDHQGISVTVRSITNDDFSVMGFIIDHIESLIKEWYPGKLTKSVMISGVESSSKVIVSKPQIIRIRIKK